VKGIVEAVLAIAGIHQLPDRHRLYGESAMFYRVATVSGPLPPGMALVDSEVFRMGNSVTNGVARGFAEQPVHEVYISAFWVRQQAHGRARRFPSWRDAPEATSVPT